MYPAMEPHGKRISVGIVSPGAAAVTEPDCGFPVGGAEVQLYAIARHLAALQDVEAVLYVADLGQPERVEDGVRIVPLVRMDRSLALAWFRAPQIVWRLVRGRHHVYLTQSASGINGLALLAARLSGGCFLHMCADDLEAEGRPNATLSRAAEMLHHAALRRADAVTCQSPAQQASIRRAYGREAMVMPNLPPPARHPPLDPAARDGVLWVGRDVECKQPEQFLELARRLPGHRFTMVCQVQPGRDLDRLRPPANLTLIPGLPFQETSRLFGRHRVLVSTSTTEGYPTIFLEAGAAGTPIVSLRVDPSGIIRRYGAGFVCDGSLQELVRRVGDLLDQPSLWQRCHEGALRLAEQEERTAVGRIVGTLREQGARAAERRTHARERGRRVWWWTRLVLVLAMFGGLIAFARPTRLWQVLVHARYGLVLAAVPAILAGAFFDAVKLFLLMRPQGFRGGFRPVWRTNLVVNFVSNFLPGTVGGGAVAWYRLSRPERLGAQTFTALVLNTVLKLVVIGSAAALALALDAPAMRAYPGAVWPLAACAAVPVLGMVLLLHPAVTARLRRLHVLVFTRLRSRALGDGLEKVLDSAETYRARWPSVLGALAAGYARVLVSVLCPLLLLHAVGATGVGYVRLVWIMCTVEAVGMLPFTQANFGLPQVAFVALLVAFGVSRADAVAADVLGKVALMPLYLSGAGVMIGENLTRKTHRTPASGGPEE